MTKDSEVTVFLEFSRVYPVEIDPESIRKEPDDYPDIFCTTREGRELRFELVRSIDKKARTADARNSAARDELNREWNKLPPEEQKVLEGSQVLVTWFDQLSEPRRSSKVRTVIDVVRKIPKGFKGEMGIPNCLEGYCDMIWVSPNINDDDWTFNCSSCIGCADPTLNEIQRKLQKRYKGERDNTELLVYHDAVEVVWENLWIEKVQRFLRKSLASSGFSRVWVWQRGKDREVFVYPGRKSEG